MWWRKGKIRLWEVGEARLPCGEAQEVHLWGNGPLVLTRAEREEALLVSGLGRRKVRAGAPAVEVHASGLTRVKVPEGCLVRLKRVNGPVLLKGMAGEVYLERVNGPINGRDVAASLHLGQVRGPVMLRQMQGHLLGQGPRGPLSLTGVQGQVRLTSPVRGSLLLRQVSGPVEVEVEGDARWVGPLETGQTVRLRVHGDARLTLPEEPDVHLTVRVKGDLHAPLAAGMPHGAWETTLGQGRARLDLEVDGDLWLALSEEAWAEAPAEAEEFPDWAREWLTEEAGEAPAQEAAEERLLVLRMLARKQITLAEADRLLQALEGEG